MGFEKYTPKQLEHEATRTESDAELIKEGAEYVQDKGAKRPRLDVNLPLSSNEGLSQEQIQKKLEKDYKKRGENYARNVVHAKQNKEEMIDQLKKDIKYGLHYNERDTMPVAYDKGSELQLAYAMGFVQGLEKRKKEFGLNDDDLDRLGKELKDFFSRR